MSLLTLPEVTPSKTTRMTARHRVQTVRFGGGRVVRIRDGHNVSEIIWQVVWNGLSRGKANELDEFLMARKGVEGFAWQPPGAVSTQVFLCSEWQITPISAEFSRLDATLVKLR